MLTRKDKFAFIHFSNYIIQETGGVQSEEWTARRRFLSVGDLDHGIINVL